MRHRFTVLALLSVGAWVCLGQQPRAQDKTDTADQDQQKVQAAEPKCCEELREQLAELNQKLKKLEQDLKANDAAIELKHQQDDQRLTEHLKKVSDVGLKNLIASTENLREIGENTNKISVNAGQTADDLKELGKAVDKTQNAIDENLRRIGKNDTNISDHSKRISGTELRTRDNSIKLREIARYDDETRSWVPRLLGNMQNSESFRNEVQRAVQGKLVIFNNSQYQRVIHINGVRWRAKIGESYMTVPFGRVGVTKITGAQPIYRNDWKFNKEEGRFILVYDFADPW